MKNNACNEGSSLKKQHDWILDLFMFIGCALTIIAIALVDGCRM